MEKIILDTSTISELKRYPKSFTPDIWNSLDKAIKEGLIVSVEQVKEEIERYQTTDEVKEWAKTHSKIFTKTTRRRAELCKEVLLHSPQLLKNSEHEVADPWIIAFAVELIEEGHTVTVATEEAHKPGRIPEACGKHQIHTIKILELFTKLGITKLRKE